MANNKIHHKEPLWMAHLQLIFRPTYACQRLEIQCVVYIRGVRARGESVYCDPDVCVCVPVNVRKSSTAQGPLYIILSRLWACQHCYKFSCTLLTLYVNISLPLASTVAPLHFHFPHSSVYLLCLHRMLGTTKGDVCVCVTYRGSVSPVYFWVAPVMWIRLTAT